MNAKFEVTKVRSKMPNELAIGNKQLAKGEFPFSRKLLGLEYGKIGKRQKIASSTF